MYYNRSQVCKSNDIMGRQGMWRSYSALLCIKKTWAGVRCSVCTTILKKPHRTAGRSPKECDCRPHDKKTNELLQLSIKREKIERVDVNLRYTHNSLSTLMATHLTAIVREGENSLNSGIRNNRFTLKQKRSDGSGGRGKTQQFSSKRTDLGTGID